MTLTLSGPCDWPYEACPCAGIEVDEESQAMAAYFLWAWTDHRFGPCPLTVRPCADPMVCCGRCGFDSRRCGCRSVPEIVLPGPVNEITEVQVDGDVLDASAYRVDDYAWLVRLDGSVWPFCQDLLAEIGEPGAFSVSYTIGMAPPAGASIVAGELACEVAKARCNDDSCRLPRRVQQITRQGVVKSVGRSDLQDGSTGIELVDNWLDAVRRPNRRARVYSPDLPHVRHTTWSAPESP